LPGPPEMDDLTKKEEMEDKKSPYVSGHPSPRTEDADALLETS